MKAWKTVLVVLVALQAIALVPSPHGATMSPQEKVSLYTGNKLIVKSDQTAIQKVVVRGNLSAAAISSPTYPAKNFTLSANTTQLYTLNIWLTYPGPYTTSINVNDPGAGTNSQVTSYYVSSGDLNLTVIATFQAAPASGTGGPMGISSLYDWMAQFGSAFPLWIKVLYLVLGAQFAFVGYRWVKFEDERRRLEGHLPPLDRGNKVYLWTDVTFKALITGFAVSLAVMVGEVLIILIAEYLFLINLSLISLVDFFSLFFVAVLGSLVYMAREGMDKLLDLKPMMED